MFRRLGKTRACLAAAVALAGLGVMTSTGQQGISPGDGWNFVGALCYGLYTAYVGEVATKAPALP